MREYSDLVIVVEGPDEAVLDAEHQRRPNFMTLVGELVLAFPSVLRSALLREGSIRSKRESTNQECKNNCRTRSCLMTNLAMLPKLKLMASAWKPRFCYCIFSIHTNSLGAA